MGAPDRHPDRDADILARHKAGEIHESIAERYGISRERVRQIVAKLGGAPRLSEIRERAEKQRDEDLLARLTKRAAKSAALAPKIAMIERGASICSVAESCAEYERLRTELNRLGLKSTARSRWTIDNSIREKVVRRGRSLGRIWEQIADDLSVIEKAAYGAELKPTSAAAVHMWAKKHCPDLVRRRAVHPAHPFPSSNGEAQEAAHA